MKVIVPCCGKSSRFPNMRPKWMLTHPDGSMMVKKAIEGLKGIETKDIIITILKEHEEKYNIAQGIKENLGKNVSVIILDKQTNSQSETIYETLLRANIKESFLVKDSDNYFKVNNLNENYNYICYSDLNEYDQINPKNKSYLIINNEGNITKIIEKKVVSSTFNVGGYYFYNVEMFKKIYLKLSNKGFTGSELFLSSIVNNLIQNEKEKFMAKHVTEYLDWGTVKEWMDYKASFKTYFFDLDGIFFKNSAQYFNPRWEDAPVIEKNIKLLKQLSDNPRIQLFFVTSRPEKYRDLIESKFSEYGIKYSGMLMGCQHAKRIIVNDFSSTAPYPTCEAINIPRDSEDLENYIKTNK